MSELSLSTASEPDERPVPSSSLSEIDTDPAPRLLGAHMPSTGGLSSCLTTGKEIGCSAVQLFTGSPRQWSKPPLKEEEIRAFHAAREQTGIAFTVAHD